MKRENTGEWIVVTGATGGIGKTLLARLVADGRNVIAMARNPSAIPETNAPGIVRRVELDFERPSTLAAAVASINEVSGDRGLRGLVNMAGIIVEGPLEALPSSELRRQLEVNAIGPFTLTQSLLPLLKRARGRIVNIGATSAHLTPPFYGPIAASKAALSSLNDAMRLEFARYGVRVILVEPGAMRTSIFATSRAARDAYLLQAAELESVYRPALKAMDRAFERAGGDNPDVAASAVLQSLFAPRPKPVVVVGKGARTFVLLSRLPVSLRDHLVKSALGLTSALKPPM